MTLLFEAEAAATAATVRAFLKRFKFDNGIEKEQQQQQREREMSRESCQFKWPKTLKTLHTQSHRTQLVDGTNLITFVEFKLNFGLR